MGWDGADEPFLVFFFLWMIGSFAVDATVQGKGRESLGGRGGEGEVGPWEEGSRGLS